VAEFKKNLKQPIPNHLATRSLANRPESRRSGRGTAGIRSIWPRNQIPATRPGSYKGTRSWLFRSGNDQIPASWSGSSLSGRERLDPGQPARIQPFWSRQGWQNGRPATVVWHALHLSQSSISQDAVAGRPDFVVPSVTGRREKKKNEEEEEEERERWFRERENIFFYSERERRTFFFELSKLKKKKKKKKKKSNMEMPDQGVKNGCEILAVSVAFSI
jgi:hypothetical protein